MIDWVKKKDSAYFMVHDVISKARYMDARAISMYGVPLEEFIEALALVSLPMMFDSKTDSFTVIQRQSKAVKEDETTGTCAATVIRDRRLTASASEGSVKEESESEIPDTDGCTDFEDDEAVKSNSE